MNIENKKALQKISKNISKLYVSKFMDKYHEQDWSHVYECAAAINNLQGVDDVELSAGRYVNYIDFDGDKEPYRDYDLTVITRYGKLKGYIRCFPAGTVSDKFSSYDILVYIYPVEKENINEAIDFNNLKDSALQLIAEQIKKAKTFAEVKQISTAAVKKGILVGTIATMIFGNFAYNRHQFKQLMSELNDVEERLDNIEDELGIDNEDTIDLSEPQWELVSDHTIATVYHAVPEQCNKDVAHTASMFELNLKNPESHKIIAMERTMMKQLGLKYGDLVKVEGTDGYDGVYQIQDTMNKKYAGKHKIDILINKDSAQGIWDNVKVYKLTNREICGAELRADMTPALNQQKVDKRQGHINEAWSFDLDDLGLDAFGSDEVIDTDIRLTNQSSTKSASNKVIQVEKENIKKLTLDLINKHWVESGYSLLNDGTDYIGEIKLMHADEVPTRRGYKRHPNTGTEVKHNIITFACSAGRSGYKFVVDADTAELYILNGSEYNSSKWFVLNTSMIKMIEDANLFNKIYVGMGDVMMPDYKDRIIIVYSCVITDNISLYRSRYDGEAYYLPQKFNIDEDLNKFKFNQDFIYKNWEFIIYANDATNTSVLWQALFDSKEDYKAFAMKFVSKGFPVIDEYDKIYKSEEDLNELVNSSDDYKDQYKSEQDAKKNKMESYLNSQLGTGGMIAYTEAAKNSKNSGYHLYLRNLYKNRKKKSDPYAKLDRDVLKLILKDNNIDIDKLAEDLFKKTVDMIIKAYEDWERIFSMLDPNSNIREISRYIKEELIKQKCPMFIVLNNDQLEELGYKFEDKPVIRKVIFSGMSNINIRSMEELKDILLGYAFYKMVEVLHKDNPNGWNNRSDNAPELGIITNLRYNEGMRYSYYSASESRPFNWDNLSLGIDKSIDLFYAYYMVGYAITNAYKGDILNIADYTDYFSNNIQEPNLSMINFDSFNKALVSGFNTLVKNAK